METFMNVFLMILDLKKCLYNFYAFNGLKSGNAKG